MAIGNADIKELELRAAKCRRNVVRMVRSGGAGHMGGAMSCLDIVTALYFHAMNVDPAEPKKEGRDRFILSAGHKCMAQYAALAEAGFFNKAELDTYGKLGTHLPGHPDMNKLAGIEANTGALGHGLSIAVGMALGLRGNTAATPPRVFVIMGDGELPEGSNWEAAAAAAHYKLDNLIVFVDDNGLQISGPTTEVMNMEPVADRFAAFGWKTAEIAGNSMAEVISLLNRLPLEKGKPSAVIAHTTKARGLSFAEGKLDSHYWKPKGEELERAEKELDEAIRRLGEGIAARGGVV
ncbi:transketolase [Spirochaetia bacterium]|nr:transketolase [Spirochaetia bacterium]